MLARTILIASIASTALLTSTSSRAEGATYALGWTRMRGAEACIGSGALAHAVEARLGHAAWVTPSSADVLIEGYVEKRADRPGWHAHVEVTDPNGATLGQRDVENADTSCQALEQPLTLMLALIIDPRLLLSHESAEAPAPAPPFSVPVPRPSEETTPAPASERDRGELEVGVAVGGGLLPGVAAGIVINEALFLDTWSVELGGTFWAPSEVQVTDTRGASFSLLLLHGRACPVQRHARTFRVLACGGVHGGWLVSQGFGFDRPDRLQRPALLVSGSVDGGLRIAGPLWLGARLEGLVPLLREHFVYSGSTGQTVEIFRMSAVAGAAEASVSLHF
jgi:hypothetical protein